MKKNHTVEELLIFFDTHANEGDCSWEVSSLYKEDEHFDIIWKHSPSTDLSWWVKKNTETEWNVCTSSGLIQYLNKNQGSIRDLEFGVMKDLCIQAVCAQLFYEAAEGVLGKEILDKAMEKIRSVFEPKQEDEPDNDPDDTPPKKRSHLKIVKNRNPFPLDFFED